MKPKIGIIGRGNVGSALKSGLEGAGYEVKSAGRDPKDIRTTTAWGEVIILAIPFGALDDALRAMGDAAQGKVLLDVTNALTPDFQLALGCTTSGAEELQRKVPKAKIVKAFNTVFAQNMSAGKVKGEKLTLFVAGDDKTAKDQVLDAGKAIGFDPVDAGPLANARWMETLGYFNIQLGYMMKMGTDIGFKLVH
jgi:8-hydroxy-5-deazaflavin:NADPH oxidoreductase